MAIACVVPWPFFSYESSSYFSFGDSDNSNQFELSVYYLCSADLNLLVGMKDAVIYFIYVYKKKQRLGY